MCRHLIILQTIFSVSIILAGCSGRATKGPEPSFKVGYEGALKNIMHKGDLSAKADLMDLAQIPHLFGLGAVENLKGEILILDSRPIISSVIGDSLQISGSFDHRATLLVHASVEKWKTHMIPNGLHTYDELEDHIAEVAEANGIDIDQPFPFLLKGTAETLEWHVIDWKEGDTEHSHGKHIRSGLHGSLNNVSVQILGFYSDGHHAIFTHHTTNMHLHFISVDGKNTGHVDGLTIAEGMRLKLPDTGTD